MEQNARPKKRKRGECDAASPSTSEQGDSRLPEDTILKFFEMYKLFGAELERIHDSMSASLPLPKLRRLHDKLLLKTRQLVGIDSIRNFKAIPEASQNVLLVIGGLEWRRTLKKAQYAKNKLSRLVFEGCMSHSESEETVSVQIPRCPALDHIFLRACYPHYMEPLTNNVLVQLMPRKEQDYSIIVGVQRNPVVQFSTPLYSSTNLLLRILRQHFGLLTQSQAFACREPRFHVHLKDRRISLPEQCLDHTQPPSMKALYHLTQASAKQSVRLVEVDFIDTSHDLLLAHLYCTAGCPSVLSLQYEIVDFRPDTAQWRSLCEELVSLSSSDEDEDENAETASRHNADLNSSRSESAHNLNDIVLSDSDGNS